MGESTDLKTGETTSYKIGGKTVVLKPVTLGKMKKAVMVFQKKGSDTFDMMIDHLVEILNNGENSFANRQWLEDNVTLPQANQIISDMRKVNGMGSENFQNGAAKSPSEVRDLTEKAPTH